jgi:hypothetical protein
MGISEDALEKDETCIKFYIISRKSCLFATTFPTTFQLKNIIENNKCSCKIFFATMKWFFELQTKKSINTSKNDIPVENVNLV